MDRLGQPYIKKEPRPQLDTTPDSLGINGNISSIREQSKTISLPSVNQLIEKKAASPAPNQFGIGAEVHYTINDGKWQKRNGKYYWSMRFASSDAASLNFIFEKLHLPDSTELFIYNDQKSMVYGPVTSKQNISSDKSKFLTDVIKGNKATIKIISSGNQYRRTKLHISKVVQGLTGNASEVNANNTHFGANCYNEIACHSSYSKQSDAVGLVLKSNGEEWCTGALINNTAKNFKPYFLSAFHCADLNDNGSLSSSEQNGAENWMFRFDYKKESCNSNSVGSYTTYNGAAFRAGWDNTDFILMELDANLLGESGYTWLGWDRTLGVPLNSAIIHHPDGKPMKVAFDNDPLSETSLGNNSNGSGFWRTDNDDGSVEGGSSGAPILNENKKLIGQHTGGNDACNGGTHWHGAFHESWNGGGTPDTQLSHWLNPCGGTAPPSINSMKGAYVRMASNDVVCQGAPSGPPGIVQLIDKPSGGTVVWSYNSTTLNKISSGSNGNVHYANFRGGSQTGEGVVNVYISGLGNCQTSTQIDQKRLWNGPPNLPTSTTISGANSLCPNSGDEYKVQNYGGTNGIKGFTWEHYGLNQTAPAGYNSIKLATPSDFSGGFIRITAENECGTSWAQESMSVGVPYNCNNTYSYSVYPNPANSEVNIKNVNDTIGNISNSINNISTTTKQKKLVKIIDSQTNKLVKKVGLNRFSTKISTDELSAGIYIIKVYEGKQPVYSDKLIIE